MRTSIRFATLLPTALALGALMGCAHGKAERGAQTSPRLGSGITAEDFERSPGASIEELIAARVPGVMLVRGNDGRRVLQIRGQTTITGGQEPLYIVDGLPLGTAANLAAINPHDVATVEVLKDAASTALYGIRGANGVILIRTKRS